eukprot:gene10197-13717_t
MLLSNILICSYLLLLSNLIPIGSGRYKVASYPFNVQLKYTPKLQSNNSSASFDRPMRTRPSFFQKLLNIFPGEDFKYLSLTKWQAIQQCGLFSNLSLRVIDFKNNGTVGFLVTGNELPSIYFSPEISISASIENPDIAGGVSMKDKNFRGMGENLELLIAKTDTSNDEFFSDFSTTTKINWKDNSIGEESSTTATYTDETKFEHYQDLCLKLDKQDSSEFGSSKRDGLKTRVTNTFITFDRQLPVNIFGLGKSMTQSSIALKPFITTLRVSSQKASELANIYITGAKATFNQINENSGSSFTAWCEKGVSKISSIVIETPSRNNQYHQLGTSITLPTLLIELVFKNPIKMIANRILRPNVSPDTSNIIATNQTIPILKNNIYSTLSVATILKLSAASCWGDGSIPMLHFKSLGNSQILRGFPLYSQSVVNHASAYGSFKGDMYFNQLIASVARIGLFCDSVVYLKHKNEELAPDYPFSGSRSKTWQPLSSVGVSLRMFGFRADVGLPIQNNAKTRLYFNFDFQ